MLTNGDLGELLECVAREETDHRRRAARALQASLRDLVPRRGLDISDSASLFAAVDLSLADAAGAVWDAKYHYGWWRPVTAIQVDAGDPNTVAVPGWTPRIVTPPYPDYPSGRSGIIGGTQHVAHNAGRRR